MQVKIMPSSGAALTPMQQSLHKRSKNRMERSKIQARQESERLKLVFLDAIAHDFRTPLTSIKASVTGLLDDLETDREQRKELLTVIDEECDRIKPAGERSIGNSSHGIRRDET
jgi:K+-sensing histidine kinase KdpD